jgi:hypothetical protein
MKLFVSSESGIFPEDKLVEIEKSLDSIQSSVFTPLEDFLENRNYGSGLTNLYVIQMIIRPDIEFLKERTLYRAKQASADYRLKIDYEAFVKADEAGKKKLMIENILQCVRLLGIKTKKQKTEFDAEKLERDIREFTKYKQ